MEFFREKNGRYFAGTGNSGTGGKPGLTIALGILPLVIFGAVFYQTSQVKGSAESNIHIILAIGIFIIANLIGFFLRRNGLGAGITVDQMERKISFRRPGTQRKTMDIDSIQKILLKINPGKAALLSLVSLHGTSHLLSVSRDPAKMRRFADELSTLISVTVLEETM